MSRPIETMADFRREELVTNAREAAELCDARANGTNDVVFEGLARALTALADYIEETT